MEKIITVFLFLVLSLNLYSMEGIFKIEEDILTVNIKNSKEEEFVLSAFIDGVSRGTLKIAELSPLSIPGGKLFEASNSEKFTMWIHLSEGGGDYQGFSNEFSFSKKISNKEIKEFFSKKGKQPGEIILEVKCLVAKMNNLTLSEFKSEVILLEYKSTGK